MMAPKQINLNELFHRVVRDRWTRSPDWVRQKSRVEVVERIETCLTLEQKAEVEIRVEAHRIRVEAEEAAIAERQKRAREKPR
jgi:ribosome-associated translation inhibitor RaiA